jgi:hypothetical protein
MTPIWAYARYCRWGIPLGIGRREPAAPSAPHPKAVASPAAAGLGMLPFALPLFLCPRTAASLSARLSGRDLLALGLAVVAIGNLATAAMIATHLAYGFVAIGMLITGCGAGLLNGETAKVSMSVIPPERGGMASGVHLAFCRLGDWDHRTWRRARVSDRKAFRWRSVGSAFGKRRASDRRQDRRRRHLGRSRPDYRTFSLGVCRAGARKFRFRVHLVLLAAGVTAALAAALTFAFVCPVETAPIRLRAVPETATPELLD